jgi:hypothetical protein
VRKNCVTLPLILTPAKYEPGVGKNPDTCKNLGLKGEKIQDFSLFLRACGFPPVFYKDSLMLKYL